MTRSSRHAGEPKHIRLYEWMANSAAWQSLDVYERQLYVEFKRRYNGANNGDIAFSGDEMAAALNCSNRPADRALRTLLERGFVKVARRGSFDWKSSRADGNRANTYTLTEYAIDYPQKVLDVPTKDFMKWRPHAETVPAKPTGKNKTRGDVLTPMGGREHPIVELMAVREHPNGVTRAPDKAPKGHMNGVTRAPANSLPLPSASEAPASTNAYLAASRGQ
ncbi:MAG: hypothetical protein JNK47_20250 [Mesorhizobium sp.]|nr:hypothetical protein [Mesorhizobium sp.]MBL8579543.1 hypothetical protein [Mesorhizobium sp.]